MPFDSNGVFSRVMNWTSDQQNGIAIECGRHDAEDNNFAEGFNETFCRDGRAAATGNFNLGNHKIQNLAEGIAASDAVTKGQLDASSAAGVSLNTDQTITGEKTFAAVQILNGATLKCFNFARGTNPETTQYVNFYTTDSTATTGDNTALGLFRTRVEANGKVTTLMRAFKNNTAGTNDSADIQVIYPASGSPYTYAPTPTEDTNNSNQIDTVGARNTKLGNYVALTGNQTIAGTKTFSSTIHGSINGNAATVTNGVYTTGNQSIAGTKTFTGNPAIQNTAPALYLNSMDIIKGTAPSETQYAGITFRDSTGDIKGSLARILTGYQTNKESFISLYAFKSDATPATEAGLIGDSVTMHYPATGNPYATAPASDVVNSIVTTINKSKAANGYFQLGNGLIVQWGTAGDINGYNTITFPKAFTSTNYRVVATQLGSNADLPSMSAVSVTGKTKTTFKVGRRAITEAATVSSIEWIAIGY